MPKVMGKVAETMAATPSLTRSTNRPSSTETLQVPTSQLLNGRSSLMSRKKQLEKPERRMGSLLGEPMQLWKQRRLGKSVQ